MATASRIEDLPRHLRRVGVNVHQTVKGQRTPMSEQVTVKEIDQFEARRAERDARMAQALSTSLFPAAAREAYRSASPSQTADLRHYLEAPETYQAPKQPSFAGRIVDWLFGDGI